METAAVPIGRPKAPAPAPVPDTGMTEAALNPLVRHRDNETMADDWGAEYGPRGPKGIHGPYYSHSGNRSLCQHNLDAAGALSLSLAPEQN